MGKPRMGCAAIALLAAGVYVARPLAILRFAESRCELNVAESLPLREENGGNLASDSKNIWTRRAWTCALSTYKWRHFLPIFAVLECFEHPNAMNTWRKV